MLTRKVVLWFFFSSERSEKIHNSTFQSQNLSIEHNFFKWDGKETKILHLLHFHRIWKKMLVKVSFWSKERCWLPTNSLDFNSFFPPTTIWAMSNESPARRAAISRLNELNVEKSVISLHIWGWNCNLRLLLQRLKSSCFWNLFFNKASLFKKRKVNTIQ